MSLSTVGACPKVEDLKGAPLRPALSLPANIRLGKKMSQRQTLKRIVNIHKKWRYKDL